MILIFTNKEDVHPTSVQKILRDEKIPFFRFNTECLLTDYEFSWWCNGDLGSDFYIKNRLTNEVCIGHEITSIWDRRPGTPTKLQVFHHTKEIDEHILEEARAFLCFLRYYLRDVFSIGSIVEDRPASSKMLQMTIAQSLNMRVPQTCISNRKSDLCKSITGAESLLIKPLSSSSVILGRDDLEFVFYSQKIEKSVLSLAVDSAFSQTVTFVQEYIDKLYELRITVVCDKLVACKISSQSMPEDKGKVDWRQGLEYGLGYEVVEVPQDVKDFCFQFLDRVHLNFGCFDFIVTPLYEYVFLECNPNGQWLWIERETHCNISSLIANALANPITH